MNDLPLQKKTSGLAITSLVIGLVSFMCCGLMGIAAVIFGHVARGKINRSEGAIEGSGLALAGLILGYINIVIFALAIVWSVKVGSSVQKYMPGVQNLVYAQQVQVVVKKMAADGIAKNDKTLGYPADAGITSVSALKARLVEKGYLTAAVADKIPFENLLIGNVSASDPKDTILIRSKEEGPLKLIVIIPLSGEVKYLPSTEPIPNSDPPRDPAFLKP
ncbi:MAG: DUF4190 domain-containing protein [Chthoniobacterales bacterium]